MSLPRSDVCNHFEAEAEQRVEGTWLTTASCAPHVLQSLNETRLMSADA